MKRVLLMLMLVSGLANADSAFPRVGGGSGGGASSQMWCGQVFLGLTGAGIKAADTVLAQFKTGAASTVTDVLFATNVVGTAGTGTATLDLTDTGDVVKCTMNFTCSTADQTGTGSCSGALLANTVYQLRAKAQCAGNGSIMYPFVCFKVTTP